MKFQFSKIIFIRILIVVCVQCFLDILIDEKFLKSN